MGSFNYKCLIDKNNDILQLFSTPINHLIIFEAAVPLNLGSNTSKELNEWQNEKHDKCKCLLFTEMIKMIYYHISTSCHKYSINQWHDRQRSKLPGSSAFQHFIRISVKHLLVPAAETSGFAAFLCLEVASFATLGSENWWECFGWKQSSDWSIMWQLWCSITTSQHNPSVRLICTVDVAEFPISLWAVVHFMTQMKSSYKKRSWHAV